MMKRFSIVRHTQRGSQSYMKEKEREEGDRGEKEEKKGDSRGETDLFSTLFPKCSP